MCSGIYKIENTINSKVYVGSSNNIKVRWRKHKALLRHNKHPNQHLQNAWNKYGEDVFIFSVVELCPINSLLNKEQHYIDLLKPEYNQTLVAGKVEMTTDRRKKLSYSVTQAYKEGRIKKTVKSIYQYDLKGNYIRKYNSLGEASVILNIPVSNLSSAANGKCNIAGGYVWRFYRVDKLDVWFNRMGRTITKEPYRSKNVKIVLTNCNEHLVFKNAKEVSNKLGCSTFQVYNSIRRNSLLLNKYKVERKIL
jgi:hypothetical protein